MRDTVPIAIPRHLEMAFSKIWRSSERVCVLGGGEVEGREGRDICRCYTDPKDWNWEWKRQAMVLRREMDSCICWAD